MRNKKNKEAQQPRMPPVVKRCIEAFCREYGVTPAEQAVLMELVMDAPSNAEIGRRLGISGNTVANHVKSIKTRTGARRRDVLLANVLQRVAASRSPSPSGADAGQLASPSSMSNLASALNGEIRRLARKELRAQMVALKSEDARCRHDLAALKRASKELAITVTRVEALSASHSSSMDGGEGRQVRFSPEWVAKHRESLGLTQADYGTLIGVSGVTICKWETGRVRPRAKQLAMWAAVKKLGKREAMRWLDDV